MKRVIVRFVGNMGMVDGEIAAGIVDGKLIVKRDYKEYEKQLERAFKKKLKKG